MRVKYPNKIFVVTTMFEAIRGGKYFQTIIIAADSKETIENAFQDSERLNIVLIPDSGYTKIYDQIGKKLKKTQFKVLWNDTKKI